MLVYLLKDKTEVYEKLIGFCSVVNTQFELNVQRIHTDNGREFMNRRHQIYFLEHRIVQETSCVDTPQKNRRVERKN